MDGALPFGLRSAPKLFSALVDGMMWILHSKGVDSALYYLNDFLILGPPDCQSCQAALDSTLATCESFGIPVAPEKTKGLSTVLTFLGIKLDTVRGQLRLLQNKLCNVQVCLRNGYYTGMAIRLHDGQARSVSCTPYLACSIIQLQWFV